MSRECMHVKRAGLVTNVDPATWADKGYMKVEAFESRAVCDRDECIRDAQRRVAANTNMTATFYPDSERIR